MSKPIVTPPAESGTPKLGTPENGTSERGFLDPAPLGDSGYSLYRFVEHRRDQTPCGGYVPLYVMQRVSGPYPTPRQAVRCVPEAIREDPMAALIVMPDGGRVWKSPNASRERDELEVLGGLVGDIEVRSTETHGEANGE